MKGSTIIERVLAALDSVTALVKTRRGQQIGWSVAVLMFIGGLSISFIAKPDLLSNLNASTFIMLFLVLAPAMTLANVLTMKESAHLCGADISYASSFRIMVMSMAANHLPAPGGPVMRTVAFRDAGASLKNAGIGNVIAGLIWIGATLLVSGACAFRLDVLLGLAISAAGFCTCAICLFYAARLPGGTMSAIRLSVIGLGAALLYAIAIFYAMSMFAAETGFAHAAIISVSGVIGAAVSFAPAGFGIRETASAGLASLTGAVPAAAFAASAVVQITMMMVLGLCALALLGGQRSMVRR